MSKLCKFRHLKSGESVYLNYATTCPGTGYVLGLGAQGSDVNRLVTTTGIFKGTVLDNVNGVLLLRAELRHDAGSIEQFENIAANGSYAFFVDPTLGASSEASILGNGPISVREGDYVLDANNGILTCALVLFEEGAVGFQNIPQMPEGVNFRDIPATQTLKWNEHNKFVGTNTTLTGEEYDARGNKLPINLEPPFDTGVIVMEIICKAKYNRVNSIRNEHIHYNYDDRGYRRKCA